MKLNKTALSIALATSLNTGLTQAAVIDMNWSGLFTMLDPYGVQLVNTAYPYYGDTTWGYGHRSQITGTLSFDTGTGYGSATINQFEFFGKAAFRPTSVQLHAIGGGLILGNLGLNWDSTDFTSNIVLDGSGLFAELGTAAVSETYDAATCAISSACALPASNGINSGSLPIGPVPIATSSLNTTGQAGLGTTLGMLSLGTDDGIGGSPMDNGPLSGFNFNLDITTMTVTGVSAVPVPAAAWLFGSGLLGLVSVARRRKTGRCV